MLQKPHGHLFTCWEIDVVLMKFLLISERNMSRDLYKSSPLNFDIFPLYPDKASLQTLERHFKETIIPLKNFIPPVLKKSITNTIKFHNFKNIIFLLLCFSFPLNCLKPSTLSNFYEGLNPLLPQQTTAFQRYREPTAIKFLLGTHRPSLPLPT